MYNPHHGTVPDIRITVRAQVAGTDMDHLRDWFANNLHSTSKKEIIRKGWLSPAGVQIIYFFICLTKVNLGQNMCPC